MSATVINLEYILEKNKSYEEDFTKGSLMNLIQSTAMNDTKMRAELLDCIQVFSNYFQKTVMLRSVLNENSKYLQITQEHLTEEFGHNISLMHDRHDKEPIWDPILESCSCWFAWKMLTLDNLEKTFLVHLVLEVSANIFFIKAHQVMLKYNETNYFKIHAKIDEHHATMGHDFLRNLREDEYKSLLIIQKQAWDVLNTACNRMAELTYN